jgi:hypothetical protein
MGTTHKNSMLAVCLLLAAQSTYSLDIRGIHIGDEWNSSRWEMLFNSQGFPTKVKCLDASEPKYCQGQLRFLGNGVVTVTLVGIGDKVDKIIVEVEPQDFNSVIELLKVEFGAPNQDISWPGPFAMPVQRKIDWLTADVKMEATTGVGHPTVTLSALRMPVDKDQ